MTLSVRKLIADDVPALRNIRLEALRLYPEYFGADLDIEEAFTDGQWVARLATATTLGGFIDGSLNGIVVYTRPRGKKIMHTADLNAMYVRESAWGNGLADALVGALIYLASSEVEQIKLTVNAENPRAIKFYERHGFRAIGRYPNSLRIGSKTYEELVMLRRIGDGGGGCENVTSNAPGRRSPQHLVLVVARRPGTDIQFGFVGQS